MSNEKLKEHMFNYLNQVKQYYLDLKYEKQTVESIMNQCVQELNLIQIEIPEKEELFELKQKVEDIRNKIGQLKNGGHIEKGDYEKITEDIKDSKDDLLKLSEALLNLRKEINNALNQMDLKKWDRFNTKIEKPQIMEL